MWANIKGGVAFLFVIFPLYFIVRSTFFLADEQPIIQVELPNQTLDNALVLWEQGQYQDSLDALTQIKQQKAEVVFYRTYFERYIQLNAMQNPSDLSQPPVTDKCSQQLLFVTGDAYSLAQAEVFKSRFAKDKRLASLPICINPDIWFDPSRVNCKRNSQKNGRLTCDLLLLSQSIKSQSFTHLVIFADKGKANVHNGIMFLDQQDSYDVFVHELAHFSGFVDEYPLSDVLAAQICSGVGAPNLVFRKAGGKIMDKHYWQKMGLDPQQPLSQARTCDNHSTQAYKPEKKLTFMEYHDVAYIPEYYLLVWQKRLLEQKPSPSADVNFAQFYEAQNNSQESRYWRTRYQTYLND